VEFYISGEKKTIVVDDRFPYCSYKKRWAFSRTSDSNEIWVLIIEKAWAKLFGSYQRIEAGTSGEALHPLTGCPTKYFIHDEF
jgi:calpain-15